LYSSDGFSTGEERDVNVAEKTYELDERILPMAYSLIDQSESKRSARFSRGSENRGSKRVTGSNVWNNIGLELAPVVIPARMRRLVSLGLLKKDPDNSTSRATVYAPTETGYERFYRTFAL
jgi:hypothetical protein